MGIKGLTQVLGDNAPSSVREKDIKTYFGRKVAIDASMCIYQFLIAVRQDGQQLANEDGQITSHLMGMFYRTIRMVDNGLKPMYVFDGKPPQLKSGELEKRSERREEAQKELEKAKEAGDTEVVDKMSKRLVRATREHTEECKELLALMGIPFVSAPCEAEAQCAELVKCGKCYAVGTEDMDALTFGSSVLLRHLTYSEARKMPIKEFHLERVLKDMELTQDQFIDLCILLGCDYCDSIKGIGPKKAVDLIRKHKTIENVIANIDKSKYPIPEDWLYKEARELFRHPEVTDASEIELKWTEPKEKELIEYMCEQKGFNEDRIKSGIAKLKKAKGVTTQGRLDTFFKVSLSPSKKRKSDGKDAGSAKKKGKGGGYKRGK
ncbi:flap endonuclease 1-like [Watersipora subatra]|uniref:flap endonuclease 1-like n=1 Tax=Watersipora subatra TaxID=2589382 RepID=UPI00355AD6C5